MPETIKEKDSPYHYVYPSFTKEIAALNRGWLAMGDRLS